MTDATPEPSALTRAKARANARAARSVTPPVPEMPLQPLVTVAVIALSALLTVSAFAEPVLVAATLVAATVALAAGIIAWGWPGLLGLPSPRGTTFVVAVGAAAAIGTMVATREEPFLEWMPAALAGSLIVAFLHQLARRDGRPRLVESIASNITAIAIIVSGATLVVLPRIEHGAWVVALAFGAVAASAVTELAGASMRLRVWLLPLGILAGGLAGLAVGLLLGATTWGPAALIGGLVAAVSHAVRSVLAMLPAISGARSQLVSACASVLTVGVVVYVAGRLLET